jgi:hypothetical protein
MHLSVESPRSGANIALSLGDRRSCRPARDHMKKLTGLVLALTLAGCATCKSTDSPEVCRTKQRDHSQPHANLAVPALDVPRMAQASLPAR